MNSRFYGVLHQYGETRDVIVLMPYLATSPDAGPKDIDFEHALVVDTDSLNVDIGNQLNDLINNPEAENSYFKTLMHYFETKHLNDGSTVLGALQMAGAISKVPSKDISLSNGQCTQKEVNDIIKENMSKQDTHIDTDEYHRQKSREYNQNIHESDEKLKQATKSNEHIEPENFTDSNPVNPDDDIHVDTHTDAIKFNEMHPESVPENVTDNHSNEKLTTDKKYSESEYIIESHKKIMDSLRQTDEAISVAQQKIRDLETVLSPATISALMESLDQYGRVASEDVKNSLIKVLATHYQNVDEEYIKKNLYNAEKRKSK